jgi:hypothetical protein
MQKSKVNEHRGFSFLKQGKKLVKRSINVNEKLIKGAFLKLQHLFLYFGIACCNFLFFSADLIQEMLTEMKMRLP